MDREKVRKLCDYLPPQWAETIEGLLEETEELRSDLEVERRENARLQKEACRFYRGDGTFEMLTPEEVVECRKQCARVIEAARRLPRPGGVSMVRDPMIDKFFEALDALDRKGAANA